MITPSPRAGWARTHSGRAGFDRLFGGGGFILGGDDADLLQSGAGNDTFSVAGGDGNDLVHASVSDGSDTAAFASGIARDRLWFAHDGNDLVISVIGQGQASGDRYAASAAGIEQLCGLGVFTPPAAGQTTLSPELAANLSTALAANWQHP